MSAATNIEWTDRTWNPTRGCSRVSAGCDHCYAIRQARRQDRPGGAYEGLTRARTRVDWSGIVDTVPEILEEPLRWRKPQRVFVDSMSDLFHESLPWAQIKRIFEVMAEAERHTFQVLTKRPENMRQFMERWAFYHEGPPPNVWLGVSVEDQKTADERIPILLRTPAAVRFVSYEPALGPVNFHAVPKPQWRPWTSSVTWSALGDLDWLIVGGESGPGARPCDVAWIRSAVEQCRAAGVPVFVKQVGAKPFERQDAFGDDARGWGNMDLTEAMTQPRPPQMEGWTRIRTETACFWQRRIHLKDRKGGDPGEWPEDLRIREFPR